MAKNGNGESIPPEVRAAIRRFLDDAQTESFALATALEATRRVFPDLDVSDDELVDAIASEASVAGFEIDFGADSAPKVRRRQLEQWDNEGGAIGKRDGSEG